MTLTPSLRAAPARRRTLIVDDTPDLRELLCITLEGSGEYDVVGEAGDGRQGIELAEALRPELVLLDLAMPVMDGLEALPHLRRILPDAQIVVLSGFGASMMARRALSAGADGYLQKGAPPHAILHYIAGLGAQPVTIAAPVVPEVAASEALVLSTEQAPFGVLVLRDRAGLPVVTSNDRATALLGTPMPPGSSLQELHPRLAASLTANAHGETEIIPIGDPPRHLSVRSSAADGLLMLYIEPAREELHGSDDMLRRAIATTAHELRNPVTVLVAVADTMRDRSAEMDAATQQRLRNAVMRQARLLDNITADLLTATQAQRGTMRIDLDDVDLGDVLDPVVDGQFEDVSLEVTGSVRAMCDPSRVEQMVTNLLTNAAKYGEPPVTVRVFAEDEHAVIDVRDHGSGVPAAFESVLFDEFTRAGGTSARGTGLGLFVVRSLAEAQGGSVVHHRAPHGGAQFVIRLPKAR